MEDKLIKMCGVESCKNKARYKGLYNGKFTKNRRIYGAYCEFHHRSKNARSNKTVKYRFSAESRNRFKNEKCQKCGWDKAYCDRHRINKELGYIDGNVMVLCPNCHREITLNKDSTNV